MTPKKHAQRLENQDDIERAAHYLDLNVKKGSPLEALGIASACNYAFNSIGSSWERAKIFKESINTEKINCKPIIYVIGAGASAPAGIPLAKKAKKKLLKEKLLPLRVVKEEINRLRAVYNIDNDFETTLLAIGATVLSSHELRDKLKSLFSHRYRPVFSNELIAHMFKHRFVDVIINFNFDETLDQSLQDEMLAQEYSLILSDGDCPEKVRASARQKKPIYIKPHGTAEYKSTLRYTREDYFGVSAEVRNLLKHLITSEPVVLVVVGFGLGSIEFNEILKDLFPGSCIFLINTSRIEKPEECGAEISFHHIPISRQFTLDECFRHLWASVAGCFLPASVLVHP